MHRFTTAFRQFHAIKRYNSNRNDPTTSIQTRALVVFALASVGILFAYNEQKKKLVADKEKLLKDESVGIPDIGKPFTLYNCKLGKETSNTEFEGKLQILYFGFTNCPDIW